ncbi:MAG: uncharacterized protein QOC80_1942 [Frankiaceae bacterium]|nr:uncharacterized protein [Frankiaceae bacterium]
MRSAHRPAAHAPAVDARLLVLAKQPVPGRVKTRLSPPFTLTEAAELAEAALADTLASAEDAVRRLAGDGLRVEPWLVLDGHLPHPGPAWRILPQSVGGLDVRLAAAFDAAGQVDPADAHPRGRRVPVVLIGMDTPQAPVATLCAAVRTVVAPRASRGLSRSMGEAGGADACFGPAADGGWWLLGLRRPDPDLLLELPMSTSTTGAATLARLEAFGLTVRVLPELTDVDTAVDAASVAGIAPDSRFAAVHDQLLRVAS